MDIYASTVCVPNNEIYIDVVKRYIEVGIFNIELGSSHRYDAKINEKTLVNFPCRFLIHSYFPPSPEPFVLNLASSNPLVRKRSLDHVKCAVKLSADLQAPFYSVHSGFITDPYGFGSTSYRFPKPISEKEEILAFERFVSALEEVVHYAKIYNILLLIENNVCTEGLKGKLLLQTADEFQKLFKIFKAENLGILLDFGHLNITACTLGFDRMAFIEKVESNIYAFHVHENDCITDTHDPIKNDSWVFDVLRHRKFSSLPVVVEARFNSVDILKSHMDWLTAKLGN